MEIYGGAWQEIDLTVARYNFHMTRKHAGVPIAAVVKANAYGHGMARMAKLFHDSGACLIATASIREALHLRSLYPNMPLWAMGSSADGMAERAVHANVALTVESLDEARHISDAAARIQRSNRIEAKAHLHIKIDTGFHRLGMAPLAAADAIPQISRLPHINIDGIWTHLALRSEADDMRQNALFRDVYENISRVGICPPRHMADSIALFRYPQMRLDMARVGALLYGCASRETPFTPLRVMCLCARITSIRDVPQGEGVGYDETYVTRRATRIATLPIGYADGIVRRLRDRGEVSLHGKRAPYAGLPCMDQTMIDVTDIADATVGDVVTLLGGVGPDAITYEEFAAWTNTNRNECLCLTGRRVPLVYIEYGEVVAIDDPLIY